MTANPNKNITSILYNHLNLPTQITFSGTNKKIEYTYDAAGVRLRKKVTDGANINIRNYVGIFEYNMANPQPLEIIHTSEGRAVAPTTGSGTLSFKYEYQYTDNTGNVVMAFSDLDANGTINPTTEINQESNYYAFGMRMEGLSNPNTGSKYKFSSKEFNDDLGLNEYDFGARFYDPAIARWGNIDPMADAAPNWTPFRYGFNNPITVTDPTGMFESNDFTTNELAQTGAFSSTITPEVQKAADKANKDCGCNIYVVTPDGKGITTQSGTASTGASSAAKSNPAPQNSGTSSGSSSGGSDNKPTVLDAYKASTGPEASEATKENIGKVANMLAGSGHMDGGSNNNNSNVAPNSNYNPLSNFNNGVGAIENAAGAAWGASEIGLSKLRKIQSGNGPKVVAKATGYATKVTANALTKTLEKVSKFSKVVGTVGMIHSTLNYGSALITPGKIKASTHVNYWLGAGLYTAAYLTVGTLAAPFVGGAALIYTVGQIGSYLYNGKTLEENIMDK